MKFIPHDYQKYAIEYIESHPISAVFLDMGLGKTVITLTAIANLLFDSFEIHRILIIGPLRVARDTWTTEADKWDHLQNLICSVAVGAEAERKAALMRKADIYIINRENVQWLIEDSGVPFDYDMVVIDELSSFKNHNTRRFRSLLKVRPKVKRIVGLTGTPASNGLTDLWAEFRILDMGRRLGRFITRYRADYFQPDRRSGQMGGMGKRAGRPVLSGWAGFPLRPRKPHPHQRPRGRCSCAGKRALAARGRDHGRRLFSGLARPRRRAGLGRRTETETYICCPRSWRTQCRKGSL